MKPFRCCEGLTAPPPFSLSDNVERASRLLQFPHYRPVQPNNAQCPDCRAGSPACPDRSRRVWVSRRLHFSRGISAGYQTPTSDVGVDDRHPALQKGCCIANAIRSYENLSFRALFRDVLLPDRIDPAHREQPSDVVEILDQVLHENTLAKQKKHRKANRVQEACSNRFHYGCRPVLGTGQG